MRYGYWFKIIILGSDATIIGQGDVTGIVSRSSIVANKTYTFNNIQQLSLRTQELYLPQLVSNCRLNFTYLEIKWVERIYEIIQTGANTTSPSQ
jgi:hypothetical protein